jgi:hypothetical protein
LGTIGRATWRNGGWLQEAWGNRAARVEPGEDPRRALRRCLILSHLPIEVEEALRSAGEARPAVYPRPRPVEQRAALRRPSGRLTPPRGSTIPVPPPPAASAPRGAVFEPLPPVARRSPQASVEAALLSLPVVALLLALVPPVGVFALWQLPHYPRDGKIAATVSSFVWLIAFIFLVS